MINTTQMNKEAFADERKAAKLRITFNGTKTIESGDILSARFQEDLADKNLTIGGAFSQSFEATFRLTEDIPLTGAYLIPEASFDGSEWVKLGKFYVTEIFTDNDYKTVAIQASDKMALLTDTYTPKISLPTTPKELMEDIATQYNFEIDEEIAHADTYITQLYEGNVRDYIGWFAGLSGANARFNREGKLTYTWFHQIVAVYGDVNMDDVIDQEDIAYINQNLLGSASAEIYEAVLGRMIVGKAYIGAELKDTQRAPLADVNQDGIINKEDTKEIEAHINGSPYDPTLVGSVREYIQPLTENDITRKGMSTSGYYTISGLISGTEEMPIESGTGRAISFYNPYMTQVLLDEIVAKNLPFSYLAAKVTYRGNPAWEVGDILRIQGNNVPIMSQTMEFSGKFSATIKSLGSSDEEEQQERVVPNIREVERQLPGIKQMIIDINESLLSGDAGYMELITEEIDGTNRLSGFRLMNTPTLTDNTKGWLANKNGIGWSEDGFKSISKLGLDMANGKIYADQIAAGAIITNSFRIGDAMTFNGNTGEITFGSNVKMSWASIEDQPDIPMNLSDLNNDEGFINSTAATVITNNAISTALIRADQVQAGSFTMTGGSINVTATDTTSVIKLTGDTFYSHLRPEGLEMGWNNPGGSSYVSANAFYLLKGREQTNITAGAIYINNSKVATMSDLSGYYSSGDNIYANRLYVQSAGNISGDPNARLAVSSPYQLGYASGSSRNFKHDIKPVESEELNPEKLYDIEVVQFKYNDDYLDESDQRYGIDCIGFIAEQVNEVYPIAADCETGTPRNWEMRYIIPPMLKLIQNQRKEIDELRSLIERSCQ